jgi:hypothetical protein
MPTIHKNAQLGFEQMITQALKAGIGAPDDQILVTTVPDDSESSEDKIVLLTVSSYLFRMIIMIYFTDDTSTRAHFARVYRTQPCEMKGQAFLDAICECANMVVGTLNRDLATVFHSVGMSTPNIIDRNCAAYLATLNFGFARTFHATVNGEKSFHVTLGVTEFDDLDFTVEATSEESTGELEMF